MIFDDLNIISLLPEIILGLFTLILFLFSKVAKNIDYAVMVRLAGLGFLTVIFILLKQDSTSSTAIDELFFTDAFVRYIKILAALVSFISLLLSTNYLEVNKMVDKEYPFLVMLSCFGMMFLLSANSMVPLFAGFIFTTIPMISLSVFNKENKKPVIVIKEYFVNEILALCVFLIGTLFIYFSTDALNFNDIAIEVLSHNVFTGVGLIMIISSILFTIGVVPFHIWLPDVYEKYPAPIVMFISIAPKLTLIAFLGRFLSGYFLELSYIWQNMLIVISGASMLFASIVAIRQTNLKRFLAYSSIVHMGYFLISIACISDIGIEALMVYLTIYSLMIFGVFAVLLLMKRDDKAVENISDLRGWNKSRPQMAAALSVIMLSMAGLPPFAGFFGKFLILQAVVKSGMIYMAVMMIISSIIISYYYLNIIKTMYFDKGSSKLSRIDDNFAFFCVNLSAVILAVFPFILLNGLLDSVKIAVEAFFK